MKKKWMSCQIVLNNIEPDALKKDDYLKRKIAIAKDVLDLDAIIIWPDSHKKNLALIQEICSNFKIRTYLWYPVLADISAFQVKPNQSVEAFNGELGHGKIGRWEKLGQVEEDFLFLCPNEEKYIMEVFKHYQKQLLEEGFDGVLLDRIRFPSPANGFETLFTCFCQSCQDKFQKEYNEDLSDYRDKIKDLLHELRFMKIKDLSGYRNLSDMIMRNNLKKFFDFREQSIYQLTRMFADEAKQKGKIVGLNLFAPSIAPLSAQNYRLLSGICDWIKPMAYCHTAGPAGLPLEFSCFIKAILNINPALKESQLIQEISQILGSELPGKISGILENGVPENIIYQEMQRIKNFSLKESVKIYLGLDAVQIPGICHVDKRILEKYLGSVFDLNIEGMVMSWNLLKIPDENIKFVGDFLLKQ